MIVRCGACRAELEVAGPGEFLCPACGTRNAVRGAPAGGAVPPPSPYDLGGLTVPPGAAAGHAPPPQAPDPNVTWSTCPACAWKFAHGEAERLTCPSCRATLVTAPDGLRVEG